MLLKCLCLSFLCVSCPLLSKDIDSSKLNSILDVRIKKVELQLAEKSLEPNSNPRMNYLVGYLQCLKETQLLIEENSR